MANVSAINSIDFEDTYDGLGDQLEEANDDFNDDTFGSGSPNTQDTSKPIGKDFDFFGLTAKVSGVINEEQARFHRKQAPRAADGSAMSTTTASQPAAKPYKTGYEVYQKPGYTPDLQVNASLWGTTSKSSQSREPSAPPAKKMLSLAEVEASLQAQAKKLKPEQPHLSQTEQSIPSGQRSNQHVLASEQPQLQKEVLTYPRDNWAAQPEPLDQNMTAFRANASRHNIISQALPGEQSISQQRVDSHEPVQPRRILQNTTRQQAQLAPRQPEPQVVSQNHPVHAYISSAGTSNTQHLPITAHFQQHMHLSEEERTAKLIEDTKRAKRNHKILLLSKDNGLMTPQDKNYITRIQLQQLMDVIGRTNDDDPNASLVEDFYYQVHSQIRGMPRQYPQQPLGNFAQTYLLPAGGRQAGLMRRQNRYGDNHTTRMEQQIQRAVEAAKLKPKTKQLVLEGSLGKISFSNAKTPKPLLNIKRPSSDEGSQQPLGSDRQANNKKPMIIPTTNDRKTALRNIETVYSILMNMEDHERELPPHLSEKSDSTFAQQHTEWRDTMKKLNARLWQNLKVMEPIVPESTILHPFIAFLSYAKGKKAIPRIFRHIDHEQRLTILTIIMVHLNVLDVTHQGQPLLNGAQLSARMRDEIELFAQAVMPSLFTIVNEAQLNVVSGLLNLILDRTNIRNIARTKIGMGILTMLISRAELVKQAEISNDQEWEVWLGLYSYLFNTIEPLLADIFPNSINAGQDEYVWRFLAAMGIGASPDQQQRLVIAVKYVLSRLNLP